MPHRSLVILSGMLLLIVLTGCGFNINSRLTPLLEPDYLDEKCGTEKMDLSQDGHCALGTLALNPLNVEKRTQKYDVYNIGGTRHYFKPTEFIDKVVQYMKVKMIDSKLRIDERKGEKILVSLEEATSHGIWTLETNVKLRIELPSINYSRIYSGVEGGAYQHNACAYAIHLAILEFLKDPVFQKHIKCQ